MIEEMYMNKEIEYLKGSLTSFYEFVHGKLRFSENKDDICQNVTFGNVKIFNQRMLLQGTIGMVDECRELQEAIGMVDEHLGLKDKFKIIDEFGDVIFYASILSGNEEFFSGYRQSVSDDVSSIFIIQEIQSYIGKIIDTMKKAVFQDRNDKKNECLYNCGYLLGLCAKDVNEEVFSSESSRIEVIDKSIEYCKEKLTKRYGDSFSTEKSINRRV
jgi:hypothetical protein